MGFFDEMQRERNTEELPSGVRPPQKDTALVRLKQMVDAMHTSSANTSSLAAQPPAPSSSWANALHNPKPLDLGGHGNWNSAQLVSSEGMQTGQLVTGSDADSLPDRQTEASLDAIARNTKRNWLKPPFLVVVAVVILILIAIAIWQFGLIGFFRHY